MPGGNYEELKNELLEIKCIVAEFDEPLRPIVLNALLSAFNGRETQNPIAKPPAPGPAQPTPEGSEIPGVAVITPDGKFQMTARDLKASSANDAAKRAVYVAILANEKLTGEKALSSKEAIVPVLKEYRAYDANTRKIIARDKGIHRVDGMLSLDTPAKMEAEKFLIEIMDSSVEGKWKPGAVRKRRKATADEAQQ